MSLGTLSDSQVSLLRKQEEKRSISEYIQNHRACAVSLKAPPNKDRMGKPRTKYEQILLRQSLSMRSTIQHRRPDILLGSIFARRSTVVPSTTGRSGAGVLTRCRHDLFDFNLRRPSHSTVQALSMESSQYDAFITKYFLRWWWSWWR